VLPRVNKATRLLLGRSVQWKQRDICSSPSATWGRPQAMHSQGRQTEARMSEGISRMLFHCWPIPVTFFPARCFGSTDRLDDGHMCERRLSSLKDRIQKGQRIGLKYFEKLAKGMATTVKEVEWPKLCERMEESGPPYSRDKPLSPCRKTHHRRVATRHSRSPAKSASLF
jgi:hypothetical protein